MRYLLLLLLCLPVAGFGYSASFGDQQILNNVQSKISTESTARLEVISGKVEKILPQFFTQERTYYILDSLNKIITREIQSRVVTIQEANVIELPGVTVTVIEEVDSSQSTVNYEPTVDTPQSTVDTIEEEVVEEIVEEPDYGLRSNVEEEIIDTRSEEEIRKEQMLKDYEARLANEAKERSDQQARADLRAQKRAWNAEDELFIPEYSLTTYSGNSCLVGESCLWTSRGYMNFDEYIAE